MSAQERLIAFMRGKNQLLRDHGITDPEYFTSDDEADIRSWSDEDAEQVEIIIFNEAAGSWRAVGLMSQSCPFCILHRAIPTYASCEPCGYGERHGECGESPVNDWDAIRDRIIDSGTQDKHLFTAEFFKNLAEETLKQ